ncbi:hypothetical protein FGU65_01595 [Methanoculleus sp. FWC-SCC1]|uniref:CHAT domain-containing protein n=1 Tax=Methanoculleus frigidifontis TaxID=2584085 RepID=A0ABT8M6P9_9EURY|nr:CHAT domain-containing protein [Methanoculleus sp. FWC-SCC1]MDN7023603.1 hypothetical protein [Methanoculleus sp. FWC-SCC1]
MAMLILECCTKKADYNRGRRDGYVLNEFLKMTDHPVDYHEITRKSDLLNLLSGGGPEYEHVYISSHGVVEQKGEAYLQLLRARVFPEEFPEGCFASAELVGLSACSLGKVAFTDRFMQQTGARLVVGPKKEVYFVDSAIFFLNLFYLVHSQNRGVKSALTRTSDYLKGTRGFSGGFTVRSRV